MKWGADRKRLMILGGLVLIGGYFFYDNVLSGPSAAPAPGTPARAGSRKGPTASPAYRPEPVAARRPAALARNIEEFRPSLKPKRPEDRVDPMTIDPTLRLDLLAKVQAVPLQGGGRNLFQLSAPPAPPLPKEPTVKVGMLSRPAGPEPEPKPPEPPKPPPPPPITLKYYGYSSAHDNRKRAFFLDGDEILVGGEGDLVKKRYRVVRINANSVVMEDTQFKHEQTLQLQEAQG